MRPRQRHERLLDLLAGVSMIGWLRGDEPLFRHWERLPEETKREMGRLRSDDIASARVPDWMTERY